MSTNVEINYDANGKPKTVLLPFDRYAELCRQEEECCRLRDDLMRPKPEAPENGSATSDGMRLLEYKNARGHFTNNGCFCVLAGSKASGVISPTLQIRRTKWTCGID